MGNAIAYVRNEPIPFLLAEELFEVIEKSEPFLIGNAGKGIVGIFSLKIDDELGEFMVFPISGD